MTYVKRVQEVTLASMKTSLNSTYTYYFQYAPPLAFFLGSRPRRSKMKVLTKVSKGFSIRN